MTTTEQRMLAEQRHIAQEIKAKKAELQEAKEDVKAIKQCLDQLNARLMDQADGDVQQSFLDCNDA